MLQTSCKMCSYACQGCLFFAASLILRLFVAPTTNPCLFSRFAFLLLFVSLNKKNRPSASEQDLRERDNDRPTIEKPRLQIRASRQSEAIKARDLSTTSPPARFNGRLEDTTDSGPSARWIKTLQTLSRESLPQRFLCLEPPLFSTTTSSLTGYQGSLNPAGGSLLRVHRPWIALR